MKKQQSPTSRRFKTAQTLKGNSRLASYTYYLKSLALRRGFPSYTAYLEHFAVSKGFASIKAYNAARLKNKGIMSPSEHQAALAEKRGLESATEYQKILANQRRTRARYQNLARLLNSKLQSLEQTQRWLSLRTGISNQLISRYCNGLSFPKPPKLALIAKALSIDLTPYSENAPNS